jgi:hypothetical protein
MTTLRTEVKSNNSNATVAKQQQVPRRPKSGLARDDSAKNQSQKPKSKTKVKKQSQKAKAKTKVKNQSQKPKGTNRSR